jgi:hypothetical protein
MTRNEDSRLREGEIIYLTVSCRYCSTTFSYQKNLYWVRSSTSRHGMSPQRETTLFLFPSRRFTRYFPLDPANARDCCKESCERPKTGRGDGGSTGVILAGPDEMNVDVVVTTTRTCQIEHKNTQRLSLVRLLRLTSPFLSSFPPLALAFLSLSPQSLLSTALNQKN